MRNIILIMVIAMIIGVIGIFNLKTNTERANNLLLVCDLMLLILFVFVIGWLFI